MDDCGESVEDSRGVVGFGGDSETFTQGSDVWVGDP